MAIAIHTKKQNKITSRSTETVKNKKSKVATTVVQATPAQTQATPAQTQATPAQTQATQATPAQTQATPAQTQATPAQTQATPAQTPATPATPELAAAFKNAFVQTASFVSILSSLQLKKDSKLQAFVNEYRIDAITAIKQLSKKSNDLNNAAAAKKLRILSKALIAAVKSDDINVLIPVINYVNTTNDDSITVIITVFELLNLSESESEEDPKDPDPKDPPESGAAAVIDPAEEIFEPIEVLTVANDINPVKEFISLKTWMDDLYSTTDRHAIEDKASMILGKMRSIASMINLKQSDITTEEHLIFQYIDALEKVVPAVEPTQLHLFIPESYKNFNETEDKDLAIKNLSKVVNARSEIRSPLEAIATSDGGTPVNKKPIPDVEEACLFNGKEFSDSDLATILKDKITVLDGRNVSRNSINMLLNLVMNNQDEFVTKLIDLGAKIPLEIKEVEVTKYATDKKRFDTAFEVTTANVNAPIVFFYHWDPILNKEGTAWAYDALVLPFDKVTLTKDAKKAKADSKRQKKTKKQTTEQPAPQPQAMTATA